jgi:hypothetical protein
MQRINGFDHIEELSGSLDFVSLQVTDHMPLHRIPNDSMNSFCFLNVVVSDDSDTSANHCLDFFWRPRLGSRNQENVRRK